MLLYSRFFWLIFRRKKSWIKETSWTQTLHGTNPKKNPEIKKNLKNHNISFFCSWIQNSTRNRKWTRILMENDGRGQMKHICSENQKKCTFLKNVCHLPEAQINLQKWRSACICKFKVFDERELWNTISLLFLESTPEKHEITV